MTSIGLFLMLGGAAAMAAWQFGGENIRNYLIGDVRGPHLGLCGFFAMVLGLLMFSNAGAGECATGWDEGGSYSDC